MDEEGKKSKNSFFEAFMWWKIDQGDIENEVQNYSKSNKFSFRKIAGYLILVSLLFTAIFVLFGGIPSTNLIYIAIYLPLAILVMRGSKFFILLAMGLITLDRFAFIFIIGDYSVSAIGLRLLWWALQMRFLYLAYRIEKLRKHDHNNKIKHISPFLKKPLNLVIFITCIVIITFFAILIVKEVQPKSSSEKQIACLKLGSDFARRRCLLILDSAN